MSVEILDEHDRGASPEAQGGKPWRLAWPRISPLSLAIAWTLLLLLLCLAPERMLPDENSISIRLHIPGLDLAVHFTLFFGFLWNWFQALRSPLRWSVIPAAGLFLAVGTELAQGLSFIHRDPNVYDALADCSGLVVGLVAAAIFCRPSAETRRATAEEP